MKLASDVAVVIATLMYITGMYFVISTFITHSPIQAEGAAICFSGVWLLIAIILLAEWLDRRG